MEVVKGIFKRKHDNPLTGTLKNMGFLIPVFFDIIIDKQA